MLPIADLFLKDLTNIGPSHRSQVPRREARVKYVGQFFLLGESYTLDTWGVPFIATFAIFKRFLLPTFVGAQVKFGAIRETARRSRRNVEYNGIGRVDCSKRMMMDRIHLGLTQFSNCSR